MQNRNVKHINYKAISLSKDIRHTGRDTGIKPRKSREH